MTIEGKFPASHLQNVVSFSGFGYLPKDVNGDVEIIIETNRCSIDFKSCESVPGFALRDICKRFIEKNTFYSSALEGVKPPLICPVKAGNYTFVENKLDLSILAMLPLDGYIWLTTIKVLTSEEGAKRN